MNRLKELRIERQFTQQFVADKTNISRSVLSQYENNIADPTANVIKRLANFYNVSADYLIERTDELGSVVMPSPTAPALADDERKLLDYYGQMSHPMKIRVIAYCEGLLSTGQNVASKRNA